jgi:hypothetical protein
MKEGLHSKLIKVQAELKAPKNQFNAFAKYKYRSAEDILEAVKPLLAKYELSMYISDQIHEAGSYMYVESGVIITDPETGDRISAQGQAGIDPSKKGQDLSQCFGSSSSYARKYALNGMFLIDDTKDADATNTHGNVTKTVTKKKATKQVIGAMKKAVTEGNKQAVLDKIADYELSEQDVMEIMKGE